MTPLTHFLAATKAFVGTGIYNNAKKLIASNCLLASSKKLFIKSLYFEIHVIMLL